MQVRMRSVYCTAEAYCDPGKIIDVPEAEAKQLLDGGYAEDPSASPMKTKKGTTAKEKPAAEPRGKENDEIIKKPS